MNPKDKIVTVRTMREGESFTFQGVTVRVKALPGKGRRIRLRFEKGKK